MASDTGFYKLILKHKTFLMGLAIICVVLFHHNIPLSFLVIPFNWFGHWGVDVFLFVSGLGIYYSLSKNPIKVYFKNRIVRLLPTCVIVGVCLVLIDPLCQIELEKGNNFFRLFSLNRWYIQATVIFYIFAPYISQFIKKYRFVAILFIYLFSYAIGFYPGIWSMGDFQLGQIIRRFPVFCLGIYVAGGNLNLRTYRYWGIGAVILALILNLMDIRGIHIVNNPYFLFIGIGMPIILYSIAKVTEKWSATKMQKVVEYMGITSLEIYLIHPFVLWSCGLLNLPNWQKNLIYFTGITLMVISLKWLEDRLFSAKFFKSIQKK